MSTRNRSLTFLSVLLVSAASVAGGQPGADSPGGAENLTGGRVTMIVVGGACGQTDTWSSMECLPGGEGPLIIQFVGPIQQDWRAALGKLGIVYGYVPDFAYLARLSPENAAIVATWPEVSRVTPYSASLKVADSVPGTGWVRVKVLAFPDADVSLVTARITHLGAQVAEHLQLATADHLLVVEADASKIPAIADISDVSWVEMASRMSLADEYSSSIVQSGEQQEWSVHDRGVDGSTQTASVCDTGIGITGTQIEGNLPVPTGVGTNQHEAFGVGTIIYNAHLLQSPAAAHSKILLYYSAIEDGQMFGTFNDESVIGHGSATASIVAGDAPPYGVRGPYDGVAYGAQLIICDLQPGPDPSLAPFDRGAIHQVAYDHGARVESNSWGLLDGCSSRSSLSYVEAARQDDAFAWLHRDFLMFRAAHNCGPIGDMTHESVAKNVITVGATWGHAGLDNVTSYSSQGPTQDGRIKPNLLAPSEPIIAARNSGLQAYGQFGGTSGATPVAAGAGVLVRDYFAKGYYPSGGARPHDARDVSSALARAVMTLSARPVSGDRGEPDYPNSVQGWGRVTIDDVLFFEGDPARLRVWDERDAPPAYTGDVWAVDVNVGAGQPLRVMLAWTDHPAVAGANPALVNDLDIVVRGPEGAYTGNAFLGTDVPPDHGAPDRRNVEEGIYIADPAPGTYTIEVRAFNVPMGPQPFAVALTGAFAES